MAKSKTLSEVYLNADAPKTPAMQKHLEDAGKSAAEREKRRLEEAKESGSKESGLSDKDADDEF